MPSIWVVANKVPAAEAQLCNLAEHLFSIHGLEVFFLIAVGAGGEAHLALDDRHIGIAQSDLAAGIDDGSISDGGSVG